MRTVTLALLLASSLTYADTRYEIRSGGELVVPYVVRYEPGKPKLAEASIGAINYVSGYLAEKPYVSTLRIEVHADSDGSAAESQALSEKRAFAVARMLIARGTDCKRLLPVGFGSTKPIADNATPEGKAQNRRTTFVNAALRGRAIGGMPLDGGGVVAGDPCK